MENVLPPPQLVGFSLRSQTRELGDHPSLTEREVTRAAIARPTNDDVIQERDLEQLCSVRQVPGEPHIGIAGPGVARGVIVHHDQRMVVGRDLHFCDRKKIAEEARPRVEALAEAIGDMLCYYLRSHVRRKVRQDNL